MTNTPVNRLFAFCLHLCDSPSTAACKILLSYELVENKIIYIYKKKRKGLGDTSLGLLPKMHSFDT